MYPHDIWFTSDPHFGHDKIIERCRRPFLSVEQMNNVLIERWNSRVKQKDSVYLLGDVFLQMTQAEAMEIRNKLNGNIHLILGNHDGVAKHIPRAWSFIKESYSLVVSDPREKLHLAHFPHRSWPGSRSGTGHLYGHEHGDLSLDVNLRAFDVGVDAWDFYPINLEEVQAQFRRMEVIRDEAARAEYNCAMAELAMLDQEMGL
jgi:calcineurin-like phosphoesterase family protein